MPTSARWEVTNVPKISVKTVHSAGPTWASAPTVCCANLRLPNGRSRAPPLPTVFKAGCFLHKNRVSLRNRQCPDGHCLFFCLNDVSFFDYRLDQIAAKAVADIVQILCVPDENVRLLARLDGTDAVGAADGGGAVERHRGQRLLRR